MVMMGALIMVVRNKLFQSQTYQNQTAALYLAELAVSDAMVELGQDPSWTAGFTNKTVSGVDGAYSIEFASGGTSDPNMSVNNFDGQSSDTHLGQRTLQPGQCLLVATAEVGRARRTVEAVVDMGGGYLATDAPAVVDGRIVMEGKVTVGGVSSLRSSDDLQVNLHSNLADSDVDLVVIDDSDVRISGTVSIVSANPASVSIGGYSPEGGAPLVGSPEKNFPPIDILGTVTSKSGAASLPAATPPDLGINPSAGVPTAAYLDQTLLTHSGGPEYYSSGSLTVGDLKLESASLYVNGNLTVNGAIEGSGAVWVTGTTEFRGSSKITSSTPDRVALYSQGNVKLEGFAGGNLMQQYAASGPNSAKIGEAWTNIELALDDMKAKAATITTPEEMGAGNGFDQSGGITTPPGRSKIGAGAGQGFDPVDPGAGYAGSLTFRDPGRSFGGYHKMGEQGPQWLLARDDTPGRNFLIRRMFELYKLNYGGLDGSDTELYALAQANAGRLEFGGIDAINDHSRIERLPLIKGHLNTFNFDHAGSSYFQGQIYTKGYMESDNDVTIIGSVVTDIEAGARAAADPHDSILDPGDVIFRNGSRLLYVQDFFYARPLVDADGTPGVRVLAWYSR